MLAVFRNGLWSELRSSQAIDPYRRNIQRAHVTRLGELMNDNQGSRSDIQAATRAELKAIQSMAQRSAVNYQNGIVKYHLEDIAASIDEMLDAD